MATLMRRFAADGECRSCGASVPDGQTKCRFCLTNYLGSDATSTDETASTTCLGIVHLVVESTTFYGTVAKGGTAANLLSANEAEPAVDDYTLIYDLDESPARQLADQWPSLPDAVQLSSEEGERLSVPPVTGQAGTDRSVETPGAGPDQALRPAWGRHPRRVASRRGPRRRRGVAGSSDGADRIYWRSCG